MEVVQQRLGHGDIKFSGWHSSPESPPSSSNMSLENVQFGWRNAWNRVVLRPTYCTKKKLKLKNSNEKFERLFKKDVETTGKIVA